MMMEAFSKILLKALKSLLADGNNTLLLEVVGEGNEDCIDTGDFIEKELPEAGITITMIIESTVKAAIIKVVALAFAEDIFVITSILLHKVGVRVSLMMLRVLLTRN
jgi:hypothetical protein